MPTISKVVQLKDDAAGHAVGWQPAKDSSGHFITDFSITDADIQANSMILFSLNGNGFNCSLISSTPGTGMKIRCNDINFEGAGTGSTLTYALISP